KIVDAAFGSILDSIYARGLENRFNIVVTAYHGFVTHSGKEGLTDFLIRKGFKKDKDSDDIIVAGGAVYVKDRNRETVRNVVAALQKESWAGAVYTKAKKQGSLKGEIKGTLSFNAVHWNHSYRAADVLVSVAWDDRKNEQGFAGTDFATGVAGHGGSSPYEIHIALMAYGPSFKNAAVTNLPTSNIDIVPTVLAINGLKAPETMQGRIINEILRNQNSRPEKPKKKTISVSTGLKPGKYTVTMECTTLGDYRYIDAVGVRRTY
ncbi:MAG: alkaline phosphatase family protein, partial [Chitinophagaceae bacterium]|nr:alkaline phosphatase family protein [Chitinophagaceae bacterium]